MRWDEFGRAENIEDRRGSGSGGGLIGGGGLGIGTIVVLGLLVINVGMALKIAVSLGFGGEAGQASILPSLVTAAIVNVGIVFWWRWRNASFAGRPSEPQHDALPPRDGNE